MGKTLAELRLSRTPKIFTSLQIKEAYDAAMKEILEKAGRNEVAVSAAGFALSSAMCKLGILNPEEFFEPEGM